MFKYIMYYYPYYLHLFNLLSFTHHNYLDITTNDISSKTIDLWSITRWSYVEHKGTKTYTASYDFYTKNFIFDGQRYVSYDDVVNKALTI